MSTGPFVYVRVTSWAERIAGRALQGHGETDGVVTVDPETARDWVERRGIAEYSTKEAAEQQAAEQRAKIEAAHAAQEGGEVVPVQVVIPFDQLNTGETAFYPPARADELVKSGKARRM